MSVCLSVWSQENFHQIGGMRAPFLLDGYFERPTIQSCSNLFSKEFFPLPCGTWAVGLRMKNLLVSFQCYLYCTDNMLEICIFAGECQKPYSLSLCSVLVTTLIVYAVMTAMYSANLIAFLSVEKYRVPFETFLELSEQNSYRFGFIGGSSLVDFFKVLSYLYP